MFVFMSDTGSMLAIGLLFLLGLYTLYHSGDCEMMEGFGETKVINLKPWPEKVKCGIFMPRKLCNSLEQLKNPTSIMVPCINKRTMVNSTKDGTTVNSDTNCNNKDDLVHTLVVVESTSLDQVLPLNKDMHLSLIKGKKTILYADPGYYFASMIVHSNKASRLLRLEITQKLKPT